MTLQAFQVRQQSLTQIKKNKDVVTVPEATTSYMTYNETGKVKGLDNFKIRQALNLATDRKGIVEAAVDTGSVPDLSKMNFNRRIFVCQVEEITGSALIEQIFSIPGIGQQFVTSIPTKDYPVIMGTTIVYAVMLMVAILLTDIITSFVDPRVRLN